MDPRNPSSVPLPLPTPPAAPGAMTFSALSASLIDLISAHEAGVAVQLTQQPVRAAAAC